MYEVRPILRQHAENTESFVFLKEAEKFAGKLCASGVPCLIRSTKGINLAVSGGRAAMAETARRAMRGEIPVEPWMLQKAPGLGLLAGRWLRKSPEVEAPANHIDPLLGVSGGIEMITSRALAIMQKAAPHADLTDYADGYEVSTALRSQLWMHRVHLTDVWEKNTWKNLHRTGTWPQELIQEVKDIGMINGKITAE